MDRRESHWQCTYCAFENENDKMVCGKCSKPPQQLGDADTQAREDARRQQRRKELHGRELNGRGSGTEMVPRMTQGVFEHSRYEAQVRAEVSALKMHTGSSTYHLKEDGNIGVFESFLIVHRGAEHSLMDAARRKELTPSIVADFYNTIGHRTEAATRRERVSNGRILQRVPA